MLVDTYGFIDLETGRLLRVVRHEGPYDVDDDMQLSAWFSTCPEDPIWETESLAVVVDLLHPWDAPFLSQEAMFGELPAKYSGGNAYVDPRTMTPVAFRRTMEPVVEGGDLIAVSTEVLAVSFDIVRDTSSVQYGPLAEASPPRPR